MAIRPKPQAGERAARRKALLLGLTSSAAFSLSYAVVRKVGDMGLHPFQIAFCRSVVCWLALMAFAGLAGRAAFRAHRPGRIVLRGALSGAGLLLWFYGLVHLPAAEATTLSLTTICFATLAAAAFLGEPMSARRWLAIGVTLVGAFVMIRPDSTTIGLPSLAVLAAAACWGISACLVRSAARTEDTLVIALWSTFVVALLGVPPAVLVWRWPSGEGLALVAVIGVLNAFGTVCWTHAFKHGDTTLVTLTDFGRLVWSAAIGFLAFGEIPAPAGVVGIGLIVGGTIVIGTERRMPSRAGATGHDRNG